MRGLARVLEAEEAPGGGFWSTLHSSRGARRDRNGFTTALVLEAWPPRPNELPSDAARRTRALDHLERCRSPRGSFNFWAPGDRPPFIPELPDDADDTALLALVLFAHGRLDRAELRRVALRHLRPIQLAPSPSASPSPEWVRPGAFATWLSPGRGVLFDAAVNTNACALFAAAELPPALTAGARETILAGLAWARRSSSPARAAAHLLALTPFYADPRELAEAVGRAVRYGVSDLHPAAEELTERLAAFPAPEGPRRLYRASYARQTYWTSRAVAAARAEVTAAPPAPRSPGSCRTPAGGPVDRLAEGLLGPDHPSIRSTTHPPIQGRCR